jgi:hypothetical protein
MKRHYGVAGESWVRWLTLSWHCYYFFLG